MIKPSRLPTLTVAFAALAGCVAAPPMSLTQIEEAERSGICCLHHVAMQTKPTRILYGFTVTPPGAMDTQQSRFPFAQRRVSLGHVIPSVDGPFFAEILVCDECNAAKARWIRRHPDDRATRWFKADLEDPNPSPNPTSGPAPNRGSS